MTRDNAEAADILGPRSTLDPQARRKRIQRLAQRGSLELDAKQRAYVEEQQSEQRKKATQLSEADAFLADKNSQWSRIVTSNERRTK